MELFRSYMKLFGYDLIFGSSFKFQDPSVMLVAGFINFCVTNQAPQVSFNFAVEDSMLVLSYEFDDVIFFEFFYSEEISYYGAQ